MTPPILPENDRFYIGQMRNPEHLEAVALINWWAHEANRRGMDQRLLIHIANEGRGGGWRQARRGAMLKQEGVRKGTPDYFLAIPKPDQGTAGLWLELKGEKGRATPEQKEMIDILINSGYAAVFAFGWDQARTAIESYLK
jgi:hypothetical protein